MIDFTTLQRLTIPEGVVTQIADASGRVLWMLQSGNKVVLEVEKITSDTYAAETTYTGEQFILLDIYPKTNGTVSVTYGGLTKTITDTSGAAEPNAQQVYFGTFNGVSDSVATPASGELTIKGDYYAFGCGRYNKTSKTTAYVTYNGVIAIHSFGEITIIPPEAFSGNSGQNACTKIPSVEIPNGVTNIGESAFEGCLNLETVTIGKDVKFIGYKAFTPNAGTNSLKTVKVLATTPPEIGTYTNDNGETSQFCFNYPSTFGTEYFVMEQIVVPKGCSDAYKTAAGWSQYADYVVEAS